MTKFNRSVLFILLVVLASWLLPWGYRFVSSSPVSFPFTLYSSIVHDFVWSANENSKTIYTDAGGHIYSEKQFDSILPTFFYRQLMADGRLPDSIEGVAVDISKLNRERFLFHHRPTDINAVKPPLYFLLEAMPGRVDLQMPEDVFRMTDRMEFVRMESNTVEEERSSRFTKALLDKGFQFPARYVIGNPTTRKEYDEGYFMTDKNDRLFHVKRLRDRPYVRDAGIPAGVKPAYIFPTEYPGRHSYCFLTDTAGCFYVLTAKDYRLVRLPVGRFAPEKESMTIFGNAFYWTIKIAGDQGVRLYAINARDYSLADSLNQPLAGQKSDRIAACLFPFELSFTAYGDKWVYPRVGSISVWALLLNFVLAIGYAVIFRKIFPQNLRNIIVLCFLGIFGLVPVLIFRRE